MQSDSFSRPEALSAPPAWDREVDVLVIGAGPGGLIAANAARDEGASVILLEQNFDIGGRAILSEGGAYLGGGTPTQRAAGIEDTAETIFRDWIRPDHPLGRYNDRDVVWAFAQNSAKTYDYLAANGVKWLRLARPLRLDSVLRRTMCAEWPERAETVTPGMAGSGLTRPLEASARRKGVEILLQYRMRVVHRPTGLGPALGVTAIQVDDCFQPTGKTLTVRARKGIILATGGHSGNVAFRRMFDPRLTEEYQTDAQNWSPTEADGEIAAMSVGAALGAVANQTNEADGQLDKGRIACRSNYSTFNWSTESRHFFRERATGLMVKDYQNVILVKENGLRFHDETCGHRDYGYFAAAMAWTGDPNKRNGGGPIWAIFDSDAVAREGWNVLPPHVDPDGYFFSADTIEGLAAKISNPYQWRAMPSETLRATIDRYNSFVEAGSDHDFGKPTPKYPIRRGPFYAAWSTPCVHDTYGGLRIDADARVLDLMGGAIPGLYATGDCSGGFALHGFGKAFVFGLLAGRHAAHRS